MRPQGKKFQHNHLKLKTGKYRFSYLAPQNYITYE